MAIDRLRAKYYNATVRSFRRIHDDLALLRIAPDQKRLRYQAGQYTVLGLGNWEPRIENAQPEPPDATRIPKLIRRAYSLSARILDDTGNVVKANSEDELEFFVALVRNNPDGPAPELTPRLFTLSVGDRLHIGTSCHGRYSLDHVQPNNNVVFLATGTGEAPHNAMLAELLSTGHAGKILSVVCVRYSKDLAYLPTHRSLETKFSNYGYRTLITREPNIPKRYIQDYFASGELEADSQLTLDPDNSHVYLCGNPSMIGLPERRDDGSHVFPQSIGMVQLLMEREFHLDHPRQPGNLHVEKYW